ncbi:MAG: hypothetical protein PHT99_02400 [Methanoregula sp.]|nr:hypothetical protein [Methanoregula sp.]
MKIQDLIENILKGSQYMGTFTLPELFSFIKAGSVCGIAVSKEGRKDLYLAIIRGEPEGAIFLDEKGELYGDKAVMLITGHEKFVLCEVKPDIVEAVAMGCRIFEKNHLRKSINYVIPEIGKKSQGLGLLTLVIQRDRELENGVRVSIRRDGKVVGSDVTTENGSVGFRVLHGDYECIVQDRNQQITSFHIKFSEENPKIILDL